MHPANMKYSKNHVWVKDLGDDTVLLGMTYFFQKTYGTVVYIELPSVGDEVMTEEIFGVIESNKASNDLISPVTGTVTDVNTLLENKPVTINHSPYEDGWLVKVKLTEPISSDLLTNKEYTKDM